jgi:hypothetical protein
MRMTLFQVATLLTCLALPSATSAQFGHPLDGLWSGEWGPKDKPNRLLLDLDWNGKEITGVINPGANAAAITNVTIDYSNSSSWVVKIEATGKDPSGKPAPIVVDGRLENIGAYRRIFRGTWTEGGRKGPFIVTRN